MLEDEPALERYRRSSRWRGPAGRRRACRTWAFPACACDWCRGGEFTGVHHGAGGWSHHAVDVRDTLADGLAGNLEPASQTFDLVRDLVDAVALVAESSIETAMRNLVYRERLIAEGAGATAVAAILQGGLDLGDGRGWRHAHGTQRRYVRVEANPLVAGLAALVALIRGNRNFRLLWFGQIVSQLGDWFNVVALYALLFELTGSATAVAGMMVMQLLPVALVGPLSGVVVDRFDRRRIMIAADLLRGAAVLGLLLVRSSDAVWFAYVVTGVMVACSGFFEPARSATVPSIVPRDSSSPQTPSPPARGRRCWPSARRWAAA